MVFGNLQGPKKKNPCSWNPDEVLKSHGTVRDKSIDIDTFDKEEDKAVIPGPKEKRWYLNTRSFT